MKQTFISDAQTQRPVCNRIPNTRKELTEKREIVVTSNIKYFAYNVSVIYYSKICSHFTRLSVVKIGWKPEDVLLLKRSKEDIKYVDHMMINHDLTTVREFCT